MLAPAVGSGAPGGTGREEKRDNCVYSSRVSSPTSKKRTYFYFMWTHPCFISSGKGKPTRFPGNEPQLAALCSPSMVVAAAIRRDPDHRANA